MAVQAPGSGFSVDKEGMTTVTDQISSARDAFGTAITQYRGQASYPPSAFGSEVSASWSTFNEAWSQELNVTGLAITELISKITTSKTAYTATDAKVAQDATGI